MPRQTEWLNANRYRKYPFIEDQSMMTTGGFAIPDATILDISALDYAVSPTTLELQSVDIVSGSPGNVVFHFAWNNTLIALPFSIPANAAFPFVMSLSLTDPSNGDYVTYITAVFGEGVLELLQQPNGTYTMTDPTIVEPALISFQPQHRVSSIQAKPIDSNAIIKGDIYIDEGHNCQVTIISDSSKIRIAAVKGAGEGIDCSEPDPEQIQCGNVLLRINGLVGGSNGEFMLSGTDGVSVTPDPDNNAIIISGPSLSNNTNCGGS